MFLRLNNAKPDTENKAAVRSNAYYKVLFLFYVFIHCDTFKISEILLVFFIFKKVKTTPDNLTIQLIAQLLFLHDFTINKALFVK